MEENKIILEMKNITKKFPGVVALKKAHLHLEKGEVLGLIGENGAGKSTLMKILLGSYKADSGSMIFKGKPYSPKSPTDALKIGISMIHQEISLVPSMSVAENIWIGREHKFTKCKIINFNKRLEATRQLLKELEIELDVNSEVAKLSVANMQLVEVARAVSYNADVIIMDEPTSALTNKEIDLLYKIIKKLTMQGKSIIFISHKLDELFAICNRITILRDGEYIDTNKIEEIDKQTLITKMVGRQLQDMFPKENVELGETILEVRGLSRENVFQDISFSLRKGEILGFCGLMGAGRTEIMQGIFGIDKITSGDILLDGKSILNRSTKDAIKHKLAMVTEDRLRKGVIHKLPVGVNMSLAYLKALCTWGFINLNQEKEDCKQMIDVMDIKITSQEQEIGSLSGGNQQKAIIGKWLMTQPEVLILDEPTRGIDVGSKAEIYKLIGQLVKQGKSILMVSSELPELIGLSDRIIVVKDGSIVSERPRGEFNQENLMKDAFGA